MTHTEQKSTASPPNNVIDFLDKRGSIDSLTLNRLETSVNDPLTDPAVHKMMRAFHASGYSRSLLINSKPDNAVAVVSYAEQFLTQEALIKFGGRSPFRGFKMRINGINADRVWRHRLIHDEFVRRIWNITACAWWHNQPVSKGFIQMLIGNNDNRYRIKVQNAVSFLHRYNFLHRTDEHMTQPVKPLGVKFTNVENCVLWATRRSVYHDMECAMFAVQAMQGMVQNHLHTMVHWSNQSWPNEEKNMDGVYEYEGETLCLENV
tara:strand:+ start:2165 stop:2953 length:789 start_codon:yes stop_codon:yes gene_type:complete